MTFSLLNVRRPRRNVGWLGLKKPKKRFQLLSEGMQRVRIATETCMSIDLRMKREH